VLLYEAKIITAWVNVMDVYMLKVHWKLGFIRSFCYKYYGTLTNAGKNLQNK